MGSSLLYLLSMHHYSCFTVQLYCVSFLGILPLIYLSVIGCSPFSTSIHCNAWNLEETEKIPTLSNIIKTTVYLYECNKTYVNLQYYIICSNHSMLNHKFIFPIILCKSLYLKMLITIIYFLVSFLVLLF